MTTTELPADLPNELKEPIPEEDEEEEEEEHEPPVNGHEVSLNEDLKQEEELQKPEHKQENGQPSTPTEAAPPSTFNEERRDSKIRDARSKFETQGSFERKTGSKRKEKVKYAGLASAKNRFMDAATADHKAGDKKKKPIRITPPRDGNMSGIVESEPAERDPNVIRSDTYVEDEIPTAANTRSTLAKFREMEQGKQSESSSQDSKVDVDPEVTKNLMSVWKTRETNPEPSGNQERKAPVKIREEGDGGVYENNPEVLTDVVRGTDYSDEVVPEGVDTRALRDRFLRGSVDEDKTTKKLSALEEITQMARLEQNVVYENIPSAPREGVIRSNLDDDEADETISTINTKELRTKFIERPSEKTEKQPVKLELAEGGVFENEPSQRREDVIYGEESDDVLPQNTVKSSLQRLNEIKEAASKVQTSKTPVIVEKNDTSAGVYENVPATSNADVSAENMMGLEQENAASNYASQAKERLLELQRKEEEARKRKEAPGMVNIWADLCEDSGVFENKPVEHDPSVLRESAHDSEEEDEDEQEDEEEEEPAEEEEEEEPAEEEQKNEEAH